MRALRQIARRTGRLARVAFVWAMALLLLGGCCLLGGCSGVTDIDAGRSADAQALDSSEKSTVRAQVQAAIDKQEFASAWNQAVAAGATQFELETIAYQTLKARDADAAVMAQRIIDKWGKLTPVSQRIVDKEIEKLTADGEWEDAAELAILTAGDAPTYSAAWKLYQSAPPGEQAEDIFQTIQDARAAHNLRAARREKR